MSTLIKKMTCLTQWGFSLAWPPCPPLCVNIEITSACNLHCVMCPRGVQGDRHDAISFTQLAEIYEQIKPSHVALHGYGEPLLHPELAAMIAYLKERSVRTSITSNFTSLTVELADALLNAGLDLLKISIDSHIPATYAHIRGVDMLKDVTEHIRLFEQRKLQLGRRLPICRLSYTILPENFKEIPDFIHFTKHNLQQNLIFFQPLVFRRSLLADADLGDMGKDELLQVLVSAQRIARDLGVRTNLKSLVDQYAITWEHYRQAGGENLRCRHCPKPWLTTFIAANGDVKPCDILGLTGAVMGNIFKTPFAQIWRSPMYAEVRRAIARNRPPYEACRSCIPFSLRRLMHYTTFAPHYLRES